ncbi:MAG: biotin--[acetyl-CoA-carboxylase] ligase [Clostridiales bacterium]|jgi:BirA family biotin operon repressor/biotin-[acetyl-CoA-carboxylase] ligase|nr:biotin--[acetyl-CoA-carboxylase] ligase [Clostridiales bacterium]
MSLANQLNKVKKLGQYFSSIDLSHVFWYKSIDSTNTIAKQLASTAPHFTTVIADNQTRGYGRLGKSFYSPNGGVYFSIVLKDKAFIHSNSLLTIFVACCVAKVLDSILGDKVRIKWLNDIMIEGKKVGGISCESRMKSNGDIEWIVVGIGINVTTNIGQFDVTLQDKVSSLKDYSKTNLDGCHLIAKILQEIFTAKFSTDTLIPFYSSKLYFLNQTIKVHSLNCEYSAIAHSVNDNGQLVVKRGNEYIALSSQTISIVT